MSIKQIVSLEPIASMMAAKILGRTIDSVSRGFAEDEELPIQLQVYRAIQDQYPDSAVAVKEMYDSMVANAEKREKKAAARIKGLTAEQQKVWSGGDAEKESVKLLASIPQTLTLLLAAEPKLDAWDNMPVIAQWAILSSCERSIPGKIAYYRAKGGVNFLNLANQLEAVESKFYALITAYLATKKVTTALDLERASGINVPARQSTA